MVFPSSWLPQHLVLFICCPGARWTLSSQRNIMALSLPLEARPRPFQQNYVQHALDTFLSFFMLAKFQTMAQICIWTTRHLNVCCCLRTGPEQTRVFSIVTIHRSENNCSQVLIHVLQSNEVFVTLGRRVAYSFARETDLMLTILWHF